MSRSQIHWSDIAAAAATMLLAEPLLGHIVSPVIIAAWHAAVEIIFEIDWLWPVIMDPASPHFLSWTGDAMVYTIVYAIKLPMLLAAGAIALGLPQPALDEI